MNVIPISQVIAANQSRYDNKKTKKRCVTLLFIIIVNSTIKCQMKKIERLVLSFSIVLSFSVCSCNNNSEKTATTNDTLTETQQHLAENALKGLEVFEGLEVHTFATEPMLKNPTNIDVDERGRVWVTEAYNYRPAINGNPTNPKGDRIMILEDTNGDGKADTAKVFYQGPEINAPLGVCVLGNKVLISQSPYVWAFYDDNGDDKADRKEVMFSGHWRRATRSWHACIYIWP